MQILGPITLRSIYGASLLLAVSTIAFAGGANPPASPHPKPDRQVKVWTNEDVEALGPRFAPANEAVPVPAATAVAANVVSAPLPPEQDPQWYAQQLSLLETELAGVSDQLSDTRSLSRQFRAAGSGVQAGLNVVAPCEGITTDNFIAQLEARRQEILEQIDALGDAARVNGMPPGILVEGRGRVSAEARATPEEQAQALVEHYENLSDQLADTRLTIATMHADAASQGATLLQPRARWGGNMTTNLLQNLYNQQSTFEDEIRATEDRMRHAGLTAQ
ncbi:MAG TPA: hypothetical protein VEI55_00650 [Candidatus Acidoferrum sp.]|nr:hypothetical protein [Candidatus Acidoferrum sp.]